MAFNPLARRHLGPGMDFIFGFGTFDDATGTAVLSGGTVNSITMTSKGNGYVSAPTVTIAAAPSGGTNATGTAVLGSGIVVSVPVNAAGAGYVTAPAVTFSGGGGAGASGIGILGPNGSIVGIQVLHTGSGYTSVPTAAIAAAPTGGTNATANTVVCAFQVASVTMTNVGAGYLAAPLVSFAPPTQAVIQTPFSVVNPAGAPLCVGPHTAGAVLDWSAPIASALNRIGTCDPPLGVIVLTRNTDTTTVNMAYSLAFSGF